MELGLRGGVSTIVKRYAKANNHYLPDFNPNDRESYLIYLDANNLYGFGMSQLLPKCNFKFLSSEEIQNRFTTPMNDLKEILDNLLGEPIGYMFDVDIEYPQSLHDQHSDYPLAPEQLHIDSSMYSPFMREHYGKQASSIKLTPNLYNKKNYIIHINNLALYLRLGLKVTRINKVISFEQDRWLKPYIDDNTSRRAEATTEFEKNFFKLMNNIIYGKTCENLRNKVILRD